MGFGLPYTGVASALPYIASNKLLAMIPRLLAELLAAAAATAARTKVVRYCRVIKKNVSFYVTF